MAVHFTDAWLRRVKPGDRVKDYREKGGLLLRVRPSRSKSWIYTYDYHGRRRVMTLGSYPSTGLAEARKMHMEAKGLLKDHGIDPIDHQKAEKARRQADLAEELGEPSVGALIDEYLVKHAKVKKKERSWKEDERLLNKDVAPRWGSRKVAGITRRDVVKLVEAVSARGAPIAANRVLSVVRRMFRFAVHRGWVEANPSADIEAPGKERKKDRALSDEEIKAFWEGLETSPISIPLRVALRLILLTGQRPGEVLGASWEEFDLRNAWWTIPGERTKNGRAHRVYLSDLVLGLLSQARELNPTTVCVFPSPRGDKPIATTSLAHALKRGCFHGVNPFVPHDLRRSMATGVARLGISEFVIALLLNHSGNRGITGTVYNQHRYDNEKRAALMAWSNHIEALLKGVEGPPNVVRLRKRDG